MTMHARPSDTFDPTHVRADFPILARKVYGKPLVYLDNAASAQKPEAVLAAMNRLYHEFLCKCASRRAFSLDRGDRGL